MPFTAENQEYLKKYFDSAFAKYKENFWSYKARFKYTKNLQRAILIEQEIASGEIWNNIQAAVFAYCHAVQKEEEMKTKAILTNDDKLALAKTCQEKEKSINDFAEQIKKLINICNLPFTDPNKNYFFWGNDAGKKEAYKDGLPYKANVIAPESKYIFELLIGPINFDDIEQKYQLQSEEERGIKYVLSALLFEKSENLPDCSSLLWAAMSKLFVERAAQAVEKAVKAHKILPSFIVYLPSQINRDGNFWLWELPVIQKLAQKINIIYKKIDLSQDKWVETSLEDYPIYLKTQAVEKKFHGESYYAQDKAITIQKLCKYVQKWKEYTGDKDRERDLSVMLNVLHGKTKTDKASKAYQNIGKNSQEDEKNNKILDDKLNKIFHGKDKYKEARKIVLGRYYQSIEIDINLCYGAGIINLKKLPTTLSGQLRLMQIAKQYHQHQFIIDIFKQGKLKNLTNTKQAQEIYLWAINRKIENTLKLHIATTETLKQDFKSSEEIEKNIQNNTVGRIDNASQASVYFEKARRLGLLAKVDATNKDENLSQMLQIYKNNLFKRHDPASGVKYLQEYSDRIKQNNYIISADSSKEHVEYRSVAERTFDLIDLYGIDECTEFSLLRTAFLSALVLKNTEKLQAIKKRMLQVEIPSSELDYVRKMNIYQINQDGSLSPVELSKNKDFIDIDNAQKEKKWQKLQLENSKDHDLDRQFWRRSYDYRQSFNHYYEGYLRGGNMRYGGVLPQQLISKGDIEIFHALLETKIANIVPLKEHLEAMIRGLDSSNSVAKTFFQEALDVLYKVPGGIALGDKTLQDYDSPEEMLIMARYIVGLNFQAVADSYVSGKAMYRQLDYTVGAMNRLMGDREHYKKDHYDSATSLSIMYALRVGDCRHHAESMQLFFDTWKRGKLLNALEKNEHDKIQSLNKVQLRVIDTLREATDSRTQKKDFIYAHTFNVLKKTDNNGHHKYTVFDAFALNQSPEEVKLRLEKDEMLFDTTRKVNGVDEKIGIKLATYSGDKGAVKPTNNLSLLGRSGIKVDSVLCAITDKNIGEKLRKTTKELAAIERQRCREEMSLEDLFWMYIISGWSFDDTLTLPENDDFLLAGVTQFLKQQDYPKNTETINPRRVYMFMAEIKRHHTGLYEQLTRQYTELMNSINRLQITDDNEIKNIFIEIQEDAKSLIASCSELSSNKDIASKLTKFRTKLYNYHTHPAISKHHEIYKSILANIGIILTGVGILAILIKSLVELTRSLKMNSKISVNNMFFFSNTASQDKIEDIDKAAKQIILKSSA